MQQSPCTLQQSRYILLPLRCALLQSYTKISGYVEQTNCQSEDLTVMEALEFSSFLRLSQKLDEKDRIAFIETIVEMLDLVKVAHERISDILLHQKKKLAVGVELIASPSILFLDEPTTGLDSLGALLLVDALGRVRDEMRVAVVCSIHQPSRRLFYKFDRLVLLAKGLRSSPEESVHIR